METRLRKKEKDLSIALMPQKTVMSCYLCYQQGMQYLHGYFGLSLTTCQIGYIYQRKKKDNRRIKSKENLHCAGNKIC